MTKHTDRARMFLMIAACWLGVVGALHAQDSSSAGPRISGSVSLGADVYDMEDTPSGVMPARRPPNLVRLQLSLNASYGDLISLPFSLTLSSRETNVTTPRLEAPSIVQMLLNPLNSLTFAPKFGWAQVYLGTHTQTFSELSGGDAQIFGAGVDLRPGHFRIAASAGLTQRAVDADTARGTPGAYARTYYGLRLAYGREDTSELHLGVNLIRSEDDPGSIRKLVSRLVVVPDSAAPGVTDTIEARHPLMPVPVQGMLGSIDTRVPIAEGIAARAEFAVGGYTRDRESPAATAEIPVAGALMNLRTSTRADYAATVAVNAARDNWGVDARALYIRPGFVTLGYPLLAPDRLEFTLSPRVALLEGDLALNATFGHRVNNLSATAQATSTQILASGNVQAQITPAFSLGASYTNFGLRNTEHNDTLKIESVAQSASITPSIVFGALSANHAITLMLGLDDYTDFNTVDGALNANNTRSVLVSYALSFDDIPLSLDLSGGTLTNHIALGDLLINTASFGCSVRLADGTITPGLTLGLTESALDTATADRMLNGRIGVAWRISDRMAFNASYTLTDMTYGSARPNARYTEQYGTGTFTLNF